MFDWLTAPVATVIGASIGTWEEPNSPFDVLSANALLTVGWIGTNA